MERPETAAQREIREELGCATKALVPVSTHFTTREGKRDTIHLFQATVAMPLQPDRREILEARFFRFDALPEKLSPATARRLAERSGELEVDGSW